MFPMITSIEELKRGKETVSESINELKQQKFEFSESKIGIMIETPAIAQITDKVSNYCDFVSIGTNDLTQYTTAADRMNNSVEDIATPYNTGMVILLNTIISGSHNSKNHIMCGVCGEIAGNLEYIPILLGVGLDDFSMNSSNILLARRLISNLTLKECKKLVENILEKDTATEIQESAKQFYKKHNLQIMTQEKQSNLNNVVEKNAKLLSLRDEYYKLVQEDLPEYLSDDSDK